MKKLNQEIRNINKNITRLSLINLIGIIAFLKSETTDKTAKVILRISSILAAVALLLNGIDSMSEDISYSKCEDERYGENTFLAPKEKAHKKKRLRSMLP